MSQIPQSSLNYDIIFAGGGASACITAGRLAAADPNLKILIVEAGPHSLDGVDHIQPARYFGNLAQGKEIFSFHIGKPSPSLSGRAPLVASGRAVGGGSSVNLMVYTRGAASDYDDWEVEHGNKGWGSKDLIPLVKKAETYQPGSTNATHGTSGPLKVSFAPNLVNVAENFIEVAVAFDKERSSTDDAQNFAECNKYARSARYIDGETGRRSDTAHHYIYSQADNTNLTVLDRHKVIRVLFEGTKAVGIEFVSDVLGRKGESTTPIIAHASRLVVVSAGAFGSPAILERSGIGGKAVLDKIEVEQVVDLPGVGENYMDHNLIFAPNVASQDAETLDDLFWGNEDEIKSYEQQWLKDGQGPMANNGVDAAIKIRPNEEEVASLSLEFPEFGKWWKSYFEPAKHHDKPLALLGPVSAYLGANPTVPRSKHFTLGYFLGYPASVGYVHATSGSNPYARSDFHPGFLDNPADLASLRWCYKKGRELSRRMKYYAGDRADGHPKFKEGSSAQMAQTSSPVSISAPNIVYSKEDDDAIDEYHRKTVETTWHSIGTCSMKPRDKGGVVDERLNVYGIQGLKVADCSIAPGNVGANMYNTAIAIGEKAAVIIAQDLGIPGVIEF